MNSQKIFHIALLSFTTFSCSLSATEHNVTEKSDNESSVGSKLIPLPQSPLTIQSTSWDWEKLEEEDRKQQEAWLEQQTPFAGYNASADVVTITGAIQTLGLNERPLAFGQRTYIKRPDGTVTYSSYKQSSDTLKVKDFGLSPTKLGYVAKDEEEGHRETFTPTLPKGRTYKASRKHPFDAFSLTIKGEKIDFDAGHGIDQADTVIANQRNSSTDPDNFVPQNRYYNQKIRNHIVNHATRSPSGSYKEISVYDKKDPLIHILSNGENCHIPIGFIFIIFDNHKVARTFYFPNLISYEKLIAQQGIEPYYKSFMNYFEISNAAVSNHAIKLGDTDGHTHTVNEHAHKGYRSLSGRYDVVGHIKMPKPAKAALRRLLAIYHMEQAAHLEYRHVENKAQLVDIYTSKMKYYALDKSTKEEKAERQRAYWQAYKDEEQKLIESQNGMSVDLVNYAIDMNTLLLRMQNKIPANDPRELASKRVQERHKALERGQSLYYPERAKLWLARIEESVRQSPQIEDIIQLLYLYDIPEIQDQEKKSYFEAALEEHGKQASLEQQKEVGDYFHNQLTYTERTTESKELQQKIDRWKAIVEKKIDESRSVAELTEAAEWYHGGRGMFARDIDKARAIYSRLLPFVDANEERRIKYCLDDLKKCEAYMRSQGREDANEKVEA